MAPMTNLAGPAGQRQYRREAEALRLLHGSFEAHFVLAFDKRPAWHGWQKRRPGIETTLRHRFMEGGQVGLIPGRFARDFRSAVADVDEGPADVLALATNPYANLPTSRAGGAHLYYLDALERRPNGSFAALGCLGDIRGGRGFVRLHAGGAILLAEALERLGPYQLELLPHSWPEGMFEPIRAPAQGERQLGKLIAPRPLPDLDLERVGPGRRNASLFEAVRRAVREWPLDPTLDAWTDRVSAFAAEQNRRFLQMLESVEVRRLAWSVASWNWDRPRRRFDHSPEAQRRRQRVWHRVWKQKRRPRWERAAQLRAEGLAQVEIAELLDVSQATISRDLRRASNPEGDSPLLGAALGVSK